MRRQFRGPLLKVQPGLDPIFDQQSIPPQQGHQIQEDLRLLPFVCQGDQIGCHLDKGDRLPLTDRLKPLPNRRHCLLEPIINQPGLGQLRVCRQPQHHRLEVRRHPRGLQIGLHRLGTQGQ